jgi:hypothetical protein
MMQALYSGLLLSYSAYRILLLLLHSHMSCCNATIRTITIVTLSYDATASNINNKLLLPPVGIIAKINTSSLWMIARNAASWIPLNPALALP